MADAAGDAAADAAGEHRRASSNQDEIDSLLGFDAPPATSAERPASGPSSTRALVSYERLPMLEIVFDRLVRLMTTSLRNFTSDNVEVSLDNITSIRFGDYLNSDPAAGDPRRVQGRGVGQLRPAHRRQRPDLLDRRRAAGRPPRHRGDAHRGPALHDDRAQPGRAHDRRRAGRRHRRLRAAVAGQLQLRPAGDQPALRHHRAPGQRRHRWSGCASTWTTAAGGSSCCCPTRRSSRSARCCCRCSWARSSAATPSGKATSPASCGAPM